MIPTFIFLLSIGLQLTAAAFALFLIRTTGRKLAWILISLAMVLMASRRIVSFVSLMAAGKEITFTIPELIAFVISCLMLIGVLRLGEYFRSSRLAEGKLKQALSLQIAIVESTTDGILVVDKQGKIASFNKKFLEFWRIPDSVIASRDDNQALNFVLQQLKDPSGFISKVRELYSQPEAESFDTLEFRDGRTLERYSKPQKIDGNTVGRVWSFRDITERKKAEEFLQESEERFRILSDSTTEGIAIHEKGSILIANKSLANMFGYDLSEIIGKNALELTAPESREIVSKNILSGYEELYEIISLRKDGTTFIAEAMSKNMQYHSRAVRVTVLRDITERKRTEETRAFLANITEHATDAIVGLDLDTNIVSWNRGAERIFGYSAEEVVGRSWSTLVPDEALEACRERFKKVIIEGFVETVETVRIAKFGRRFPAEMTITILNDKNGNHIGYVSITRDITERKRIEKSLKESEEKYRDLIESANDLIQSVDADMRFLFVNKKWKEILEYSDEEIRNLTLTDILRKDMVPHCMEIFKEISSGKILENIEVVFVSKNGNEIFVEGNVDAYIKDGKFVSTRGTFRDVTERRKLEEQLFHSQKMEAIGQLAGGIAHEFNNILTAIIGYGNILMMNMKEDDPLRHNVKRILASSERAANLTKGLLTYSRKQITAPSPVNLNEIVKKTEGLLLRIIGEDIELRTVLSGEELTVMADSGQMEQVLMNLATNARDAMPDGGSLTISTELVEIDMEFINIHGYGEPGMYALISVADTGIGIEKKMMEKIFEPFFTTKEIGKGTGLGLAMVYGIIKQHNGYINCYSEPGKGTTLRIYLPLCISDLKTSEGIVPEFEIKDSEQIKGGTETVLVAEDDKALRKLIKTVLKEFGYNVIDAVDGEDAVGKFIENRDSIKLLVLDVIMPKKNGREVYEEIRKVRPDIKALFTSGYDRDIIHRKGILEEGINFIPKPVSPRELARKVREILDR